MTCIERLKHVVDELRERYGADKFDIEKENSQSIAIRDESHGTKRFTIKIISVEEHGNAIDVTCILFPYPHKGSIEGINRARKAFLNLNEESPVNFSEDRESGSPNLLGTILARIRIRCHGNEKFLLDDLEDALDTMNTTLERYYDNLKSCFCEWGLSPDEE